MTEDSNFPFLLIFESLTINFLGMLWEYGNAFIKSNNLINHPKIPCGIYYSKEGIFK